MSSDLSRPSVYTPFLRRFTDEPARDLAETIALCHQVKATYGNSVWSQDDLIERLNGHCAEIVRQAVQLPEYSPFLEALDRCQKAVIAGEGIIVSFPDIDWNSARLSMKEQVDLRRFLRAKQRFLANFDRVGEMFVEAICYVMAGIVHEMPAFSDEDPDTLSVPLISLLSDPKDTVARIMGTFMTEPLVNAGLFTALQKRFYENQCRVSGLVPYQETKRPLVGPDESDLGPEELVDAALVHPQNRKILCSHIVISSPFSAVVASFRHCGRITLRVGSFDGSNFQPNDQWRMTH